MSTTDLEITGVDFVCVPVDDFERAVEFYGEVLGLPCIARYGEAPSAEFQTDTFDSGVCHQAIFRDPAGNPLDLHHRYAPPKEKPGS